MYLRCNFSIVLSSTEDRRNRFMEMAYQESIFSTEISVENTDVTLPFKVWKNVGVSQN